MDRRRARALGESDGGAAAARPDRRADAGAHDFFVATRESAELRAETLQGQASSSLRSLVPRCYRGPAHPTGLCVGGASLDDRAGRRGNRLSLVLAREPGGGGAALAGADRRPEDLLELGSRLQISSKPNYRKIAGPTSPGLALCRPGTKPSTRGFSVHDPSRGHRRSGRPARRR